MKKILGMLGKFQRLYSIAKAKKGGSNKSLTSGFPKKFYDHLPIKMEYEQGGKLVRCYLGVYINENEGIYV